jgi:hypothetical protein
MYLVTKKISDKENFVFNKLIFDKVFSFYTSDELNYEISCCNIQIKNITRIKIVLILTLNMMI